MDIQTSHHCPKERNLRKRSRSSSPIQEKTKTYNLRSKRIKKTVPEAATSKHGDDIGYLQLDKENDEIRVLILQPGAEQDDLCCTLETYPLESCREFEALSYAWGDPKPTEPIFVNGSRTLVARNLGVALRHLRYTDSNRVLWIDAVCINQTDTSERNHQVFMMGRVYSTASRVLIWLGEARGSSDLVMDNFKELGKGQELTGTTKTVLSNLLYDSLMTRAWWSRLWVIQEVVLGKSDPIIICGTRCLSWDLFKNEFGKFALPIDMTKGSIWAKFTALYKLREAHQRTNIGLSLNTVLRHTAGFQAADPRDVIYGSIGMLGMSERQSIKPNYRTPTGLLFLQVTKLFLERSSGRFYSRFSIREKSRAVSKKCPSWVPDFSAQEIFRTSSPTWLVNNNKSPPCRNHGQRRVSFQDDYKVLAIAGLFFDRIEVAVELRSEIELLNQIPKLERLVQQALETELPSSHYLRKFKKLEDLFAMFDPGIDASSSRHQYKVARADLGAGLQTAAFRALLNTLTYCILPGRSFFLTSMGFCGVATTKVHKNDSVAFLSGEHLPMILRPRGTEYTMVGAADISGVMSGEIISETYQNGLIEETTFLIR